MQSRKSSAPISRSPKPRLRRLIVTVGSGGALLSSLATAAREPHEKDSALAAPISQVTVYSDRARVVRAARLELSETGTRRLVLPLLSTKIDAKSIRIDARPATPQGDVDVERVEIERIEGSELPVSETQKLLESLEQLDDQISRLGEERSAYQSQLDLLGRLTPAAPPVPSILTGGKPTTLNPAGWGTVFGFLRGAMEKLHGSLAENSEKSRTLSRKREQLMAEVRLLGGAQQRSAYRVTATLHGHGPALLWLSYVTPSARWLPTYDIALVAGRNQVELGFAGQVSQETGEDWNDVALVLSTAVPAAATQAPKLLAWKLGARERFIPTPPPVSERPPPPPPPLSPLIDSSPNELLRRRLLARAGFATNSTVELEKSVRADEIVTRDRDGDGVIDQIDTESTKDAKAVSKREAKAEAMPMEEQVLSSKPMPVKEMPAPVQPAASRQYVTLSGMAGGLAGDYDATGESYSGRASGYFSIGAPRVQVVGVGLAPPPAYRPPPLAENSPAALAGGYDLSYPSLYKETIASGKGARRVALFSRSFPVAVQRKVFAALAKEAYLVAEINNPSKDPLPGGQANLFVGADPAGVATIHLVAPGEAFTLPLGLDRAVKVVRNVKLSTVEKGVFSKDEISEYVVTTELSNPHRQPIDVRILDQVPLAGDKNVDVQLLRSEPPATTDRNSGGLQWRLTVPAGGKIETRFVYTLRRPKGARLHQ